jgi:hypothetical protein
MEYFRKKLLFLLFFIIFLLNLRVVYSFGISPGLIDLGELERDSNKIIKFYIITSPDESTLINLEAEEGNIDLMSGHFNNLFPEYSEQPVSSWIKFITNPIQIKPREELKTIGGTLKNVKEVNFILRIPNDAEPGYHLLAIRPSPLTTTGQGPTGVNIVTVVPLTILFRVPGQAVRGGRILDIVSGGLSGNRLVLNIYFQNTGTVTISSRADDIKFYDDSHKLIFSSISNLDRIKPNEVKVLKAYIDTDDLDFGTYNVSSSVNFLTGRASKLMMVTFEKAPIAGYVTPKKEEFPYLVVLIIFVIIIIAYAIYKWV